MVSGSGQRPSKPSVERRNTVRAVVITDEETLRLEDRPDPVAQPGEVVIDVRAAGLNSADSRQVHGGYPAPPGWPADIPGLEVSGVVASVGDSSVPFTPGDRVMALLGGGGQAERVAVPANLVMAVPERMSWEEAAGFPEAYATAWDAVVSQAGVRAGDRVLVTGAAGGVGSAVVQIAVVSGAHVTASVRATSLHDQVRTLASPDRLAVITPEEEGQQDRYDIIIDVVGDAGCLERLKLLRTRGRMILIGILGTIGTNDASWISAMMVNRLQLRGTTIRTRTPFDKAALIRDVADLVVPLVAEGRLRVPIDSAFPIDRFEDAYARLTGPGKFGKIVLTGSP
jgi:NADPH:quinone reductase-like Zn-dependent oxidoreductase